MKTEFSRGFTLVELMVAISVAGILLAVGVPSFSAMIQNNRMSSRINEMVAEINFARSEAVKRGSPVTLCRGTSSGCNSNAAWASGWIVFSDVTGNGVLNTATDAILRVHGVLTGISSVNFSNSSTNRITFSAAGSATGYATTITFCDSRGVSHAMGLVLSNSGRLRKWVTTDNLVLVCQ